MQDSLNESSVRPNPTLVFSKIRFQFDSRIVKADWRGYIPLRLGSDVVLVATGKVLLYGKAAFAISHESLV